MGSILNISPVDGCYAAITAPLRAYFSEAALIGGRLEAEKTAFRSVAINSATRLAVTHIDLYEGGDSPAKLSDIKGKARTFLDRIARLSKIYPYPELSLVSYGPGLMDVLDLRK